MIEDYRGTNEGGRLLILGNGPSAAGVDLQRVDCPVIGLNQAWRLSGRGCDYLLMGDPGQYEMLEAASATYGLLITTETGPSHAIRITGHHVDPQHPKRFSFDLTKGVYLNNTIASFGFQLATYMLGLWGTIYLLGVDSTGKSFTGAATPPEKFANQRETLGYIAGVLSMARPSIKVYDLSLISTQKVFKRMSFDEAFPIGENKSEKEDRRHSTANA